MCVRACRACLHCDACVLCAVMCGLSGACCVCCFCVGDLFSLIGALNVCSPFKIAVCKHDVIILFLRLRSVSACMLCECV